VPLYFSTIGLSSIGVVSGATFREDALELRKLLPNAPFLIPGYGAQGASANDACAALLQDTKHPNLLNFGLINASRSILFPEETYLANNIEEWQKIVFSKINFINNELTSINN
jgi:orotidine-5'-phosphate decarboxylase